MHRSRFLRLSDIRSWRFLGLVLIVNFHLGVRGLLAADLPPAAPGGLRIIRRVETNSTQRSSNAVDARPMASTNLQIVQAASGTATKSEPSAPQVARSQPAAIPFVIPLLIVSFFPTNGTNIDIQLTGDVGGPVVVVQEKTRKLTQEIIGALQEGSRYRAYANPSNQPALIYEVAATIEYFEPLPTKKQFGPDVPMTDYRRIMERIQIREWVEDKGIKEVWIWGYHGGKLGLWESNMSSPHGDVSNSDCNTNDLPILKRTYTVYHYNYQRGASEAVENHVHQIEALLNFVDGRNVTPPDQWSDLLFWGKFVGSDKSHHIVRPGCGWSHYPPNAIQDYDWANRVYVQTDMDDWKPDGSGRKSRINCERWGCDSLKWFVYWMQHLPGPGNDLESQGKRLNNWWTFIGAWDQAMERSLKLVGD